MSEWQWLTEKTPQQWGFLGRIIVKATLLFGLCNVIFALAYPASLETVGRLSIYNTLVAPRDRLPYLATDAAGANNVTLNNIPAMVASHRISQPKADDEVRVLLLGDSGTWGWGLSPHAMLSAALNELALSQDGRRLQFYNLAYPSGSVLKDLLLLEAATAHEPDLIVWMLSLSAFDPERRYDLPILTHNRQRVERLVTQHSLNLDLTRYPQSSFTQQTLIGQRAALSAWWRLQATGLAWQATGVDQVIRTDFAPLADDLEARENWAMWDAETQLTQADLPFDVLRAAQNITDAPILLVNAPIFTATGANSDLRVNSLYPRWAYAQYRALLAQFAADNAFSYRDAWDSIPRNQFTDSPLHYTPQGAQILADQLADPILNLGG